MAGRDPPSVQQSGISLKQRLQAKSADSPIASSADSYQKYSSVVARDRGRVSARQPRYFLLLRQKISTQRKGDPTSCVPSLRSGQTCITQFRLRCLPTRCALAALRSNKRRQVRARCNAVLRQRCPQPEPRAAGASTRAGADTDGLLDL